MEIDVLWLVAGVAIAGVVAQWIGWRFRFPSILVLLAFGLLIGPAFGWVRPGAILGPIMQPAIGMAVAIIVFEGGLNLNFRELHTAGSGAIRLVGLALPLNWLFGTLAAHWLGGFSWTLAILFGSIVVVTGPTVVMPLLRQAKLEPRSAAFLKWEGIVNDPLGASLALLLLSFFLALHAHGGGLTMISHIAVRAVAGAAAAGALGVLLPVVIRFVFHHDGVPEFLKTAILLAGVMGIYAVGEAIQPETGLVGATIFGVVLANIDITGLQELRRFKESLTVFLVSGIFILLTANIDPAVIRHISWPVILTAGAVLLVVRPLAIGLATIGARMTWRERVLVGWIGPRGVVAAAVAGLAGDQLAAAGYPGANLILPTVFSVIAATVLVHGLSLGPLARLLGLASGAPPGLLIVGASPWTVALARTLHAQGVPTLIVDSNWEALRLARRQGLPSTRVEILSARGEQFIDLRDLDYLIAATDDDAYNALVCTRFAPDLGRERVHQPPPAGQREAVQASREWRGKYVPHATLSHARLSELVRDGYGFTLKDEGPDAENPGDERWPVLAIDSAGELTFFSPEAEPPSSAGQRVIWFEKTHVSEPASIWGRSRRDRAPPPTRAVRPVAQLSAAPA